MLLFGVVLMVASLYKIRNQVIFDDKKDRIIHLTRLVISGVQVGILTGLLGTGGGCIIIPVLSFSSHLTMKQAIGTSRLIMSMNSLLRYIGDLFYQSIDWPLLLTVTTIFVAGTFRRRKIGVTIPGDTLEGIWLVYPGYGFLYHPA